MENIQSLEILSHALRQKLRNVFGGSAVLKNLFAMSLCCQSVVLSTSGKFVDAANLLLVDVEDRDQR